MGGAAGVSMDFTISLPEWAVLENEKLPEFVETLDERMRVVNEFARRNVEENTGGPFAAGVFERDTGRVVIVGINRVEPMQCSSAHAEVVTLSLAQKKLGTWNLGEPGKPALQLVVNWLPCAMCLGAVLWSGVRSLAIAGLANDSRLEEITGFDEGPRVDMAKELAKRDVEFIDNGAPFILFFLHASFADDRSRPCVLFRFSLFCEQFSPRRLSRCSTCSRTRAGSCTTRAGWGTSPPRTSAPSAHHRRPRKQRCRRRAAEKQWRR